MTTRQPPLFDRAPDDRQKRDRAELRPTPPREKLDGPRAAAIALGRRRRRRLGPHR